MFLDTMHSLYPVLVQILSLDNEIVCFPIHGYNLALCAVEGKCIGLPCLIRKDVFVSMINSCGSLYVELWFSVLSSLLDCCPAVMNNRDEESRALFTVCVTPAHG